MFIVANFKSISVVVKTSPSPPPLFVAAVLSSLTGTPPTYHIPLIVAESRAFSSVVEPSVQCNSVGAEPPPDRKKAHGA